MDHDLLRGIAREGLVSTAAAEMAGLDRRELAEAARRGVITRVGRGWYAIGQDLNGEHLHRLRAAAALIGHPRRAASHHTGLILRHLPTLHAPLETVQLVAPTSPRTPPTGVRLRRREDFAIEQVAFGDHDLPSLPVAVCIVEAGCQGSAESALISADCALRLGLTSRAGLGAALAAAAGRRGVRELRIVLSWVDARHESPGESRLGYSLHRLGWRYEPQVAIGPYRVDALLVDAPVVVEFDGALKYDRRQDRVAEKVREDRIRAEGYGFVRCGWSDVGDLVALDRAIRQAVLWRSRAG